ncbi:VCBS domain-containing protein [Desulforhopalus sp. 52FAK]
MESPQSARLNSSNSVKITDQCRVQATTGTVFILDEQGRPSVLESGKTLHPGDIVIIESGSMSLTIQDGTTLTVMSRDQVIVSTPEDISPDSDGQVMQQPEIADEKVSEEEAENKPQEHDAEPSHSVELPFVMVLTGQEVTPESGVGSTGISSQMFSSGNLGALGVLSSEIMVLQVSQEDTLSSFSRASDYIHDKFTFPSDLLLNPGSQHGNNALTQASITMSRAASGSAPTIIPPHAAVFGGIDSGSLTEDSHIKTEGILTVTDPNPGEDHFNSETQIGATGTFSMNTNGHWSFALNNASPTIQTLAAGETLTNTFIVHSADGTRHQVVLTIKGTNDNPVINSIASMSVDEDGTAVTGQISSIDVDHGDTATYSTSVTHPGFTLNPDGSYSLDPKDASFQHLAAGEKETITIPVVATDNQGGQSTPQNLVITVTGTNDNPVVQSIAAKTVAEDGTPVTGQISSTDVDHGDTATYSTSVTHPGFTLNPDGSYSLDPKDASFQHLAAGEKETITIPVVATDKQGGQSTPQNLVITVTGTNDNPVVQSIAAKTVAEDGAPVTGQMSSTDVDHGDTATYSTSVTHPGFTLNPDGSYSLDPTDASFQHLAAGEKETITIPVVATDNQGGQSTPQNLVITVTGTNDNPVVQSIAAKTVAEDGTPVTGQISSTDVDHGDTATYSTSVTHPGFTLNQDGSYSLDPKDASFQHLAAGEKETITIPVVATDNQGGQSTPQNIVITVTGTNDNPVVQSIAAKTATEDGAPVTGQISSTDVDHGDTATYSTSVTHPGFTLNPDGSYSLDPKDASFQHLAVGEKETITIPVVATDNQGGQSTPQNLVITVTGTNDNPVVQSIAAKTVAEDGTPVTGQISSTDVDHGDTATYSTSVTHPGFTLNPDGSYSLDPTDASFQHLAAGEKETITIPVVATDNQGGQSTPQNLVITVAGTNDNPVVQSIAAKTVAEDGTPVTGQISSTDVDHGDTATYSTSVTHPGFTLNPDGSYSLDPTDASFQHLAAGEKETITIPVVATDNQGGQSTPQNLVITVTGTNDNPVVQSIAAKTVAEDGTPVTGQIRSTDVDHGDTVSYSTSVMHPGFTLNPDGSYSLDPKDPSFQHLAAGEKETITIPVVATDNQGGQSTPQNLVITVTGTNDNPVVQSIAAKTVAEDGAPVTGQISSTDVDHGDTATYSTSVTHPGFTLNPDGSYSLDPTDASFQHLAAGEHETITIPVVATDNQGGQSTPQNLVITVTGTNDNPVVQSIAAKTVAEDGTPVTGQISSTDVDHGDTATYSTSVTQPGFTLNPDGSYSLDPKDASFQHLAAGEKETITIPVVATDNQGGQSTPQNLVITVTGTNDAPVVSGATTLASGTEDTAVTLHAADLLSHATDVDTTDTLSVQNLKADHGTITSNPDGSFTFTPDKDYNGPVSLSYEVTDGHGGTVQTSATMNLAGVGDAATFSGDDSGSLKEDVHVHTSTGTPRLLVSGFLDVHDPDAGQDHFQFSQFGEHAVHDPFNGHLQIDRVGSWAYEIDNNNPVLQRLGEGQTEVVTYRVRSADGTTHDINVTVTGTNDSPVLQAQSQSVTEDGSLLSGQMVATDVDSGDTQSFSAANPPAGFTLNKDGSYSFDPTDQAYQHLAAGQTEKVTIPVTVTDSAGATSTQNLEITVTGTNDAPVVSGATTLASGTEDTAVTLHAADLLSHATDVDTTDTLTVQNLKADHGTITTNPDGSFTFTPDKDYNGPVSLSYEVADGHGGTAATSASITLAPTGDAATIAGTDTGQVVEDQIHGMQWLETFGKLSITDPDAGEARFIGNAHYQPAYPTSMGGSVVIAPDGNWSYIIDNNKPAVQQLKAGESAVDRATVRSADGTTHEIQITIHGTNDAPMLQAQSQSVTEDGSLLSGQMVATDVDSGDTQSFSAANPPAGFTLNKDGSYSFDPTDQAYQHLAAGQTEKVTIPVTVTDSAGATSTQNLEITVSGTNDAPMVSGATTLAPGTEDTSVTLQAADLLSHATDVDTTDTLSVANLHADHGKITSNPDGSFTFTPDKDYNGPVSLSYEVTDGHGGTVQTSATMNLAGVGDAAVITGTDTGDVTEDRISYGGMLRTHGQLTVTDPDSGEAVFVGDPVRVTYPTSLGGNASLAISPDGSWIYTGDNNNPKVQALKAGETLVDTVTVHTKDGTSHQIQITIHGTNDAPVLQAQSQSVTEDGSLLSGQMVATDVDTGDTQSFSAANPPAGFTLNKDGSYSFDPTDQAYQHLAAGQTEKVTIPVTVTDSAGATSTQNLEITVSGTNDAPMVSGATTLAPGTEDTSVTLQAADLLSHATDVDTTDTLSVANLHADHGKITSNPDGSFTFTPDKDYNGPVSLSYEVTDGHGGTVQTSATMNLAGVGDAATFSGDDSGSLKEDVHVHTSTGTPRLLVSGFLDVHDPDAGQDHFQFSQFGEHAVHDPFNGHLQIDRVGSWAYEIDNNNPVLQRLGEGQTEVVTYRVRSADGTTHDINVTVTGTNDAPVLQAQSQSVTEDSTLLQGQMVATDVDTGDTQSFNATAQVAGFNMKSDGSYTFDPTDQAYQHLAAGQTEKVTIPVTVTDSQGATSTQNLEITVSGTNDAPVVAPLTDAVDEDVASHSVDLLSGATDAEGDSLAISGVQFMVNGAATAGLPPGVTMDGDGHTLHIDTTGQAYQHLAAGQQEEIKVSYMVEDGHGGQTQQTATLTVEGQDDKATLVSNVIQMTETVAYESGIVGNDPIRGHLQLNDPDDGAPREFVFSGSYAGQGQAPGHFTIWPDGSYEFNVEMAGKRQIRDVVDGLKSGETLEYKYNVQTADHQTKEVIIRITGEDDAARIEVNPTQPANQTVYEDYTSPGGSGHDLQAGGILSAIDPDHGEAGFKPQRITTSEGGHFQISESGSWSFWIDNNLQAVQQLGARDTIVKTFTVQSIDGSATHDIQVTIQGTNDVPVLQAQSQSVTEDGSQLSGQMVATDSDTGDTQSFTSSAQVGGFSMKSDGSYTFDPTDQAYQHLAAGQTEVIRIPVTVTDSAGATSTQNHEITVTGTNDAPTVTGATTLAAGSEDTGVTLHASDLLQHATDVDTTDTLSVQNLRADHGTITDNKDGTFSFTPDKDYNGQVSFSYQVQDGHGGSTPATATMNLAAVGDAATFSGDDTGGIIEDKNPTRGVQDPALLTYGHLAVSDADAGQSNFGPRGSSSSNDRFGGSLRISEHGNWRYEVSNSKVQHLSEGQQVQVTHTVHSADGTAHDIVITITGTNDAPTVSGTTDLGATDQDQSITFTQAELTAHVTDIDGDKVTVSSVSVDPSAGTVSSNPDGSFTFTPAPGFSGDNVPVSFTATDGKATAQGAATIDVHQQVNHAPVIDTSQFTSHKSGHNLVGSLGATDTDKGDSQRWSVVTPTGGQTTSSHGQLGSFSIDANSGSFTYAPDGAGGQVQKSGKMPPAGQVIDSFLVAVTDSQGLSHQMQVDIQVETNARHVHGASGHWVARIVPVGASLNTMTSHDEALTDPDMTVDELDAQLIAASEEIHNLETEGKDSSQAQDRYDALMDHKSDLEGAAHTQEPVQQTPQGGSEIDEVSISLDNDQQTISHGSQDQSASIFQPESETEGVESDGTTEAQSTLPDLSGLLSEETALNFDSLNSGTSSASGPDTSSPQSSTYATHEESQAQVTTHTETGNEQSETTDRESLGDKEDKADSTDTKKGISRDDILHDEKGSIDTLLSSQPEKPLVPVSENPDGNQDSTDTVDPSSKHSSSEDNATPDSGALDSNLVETPDDTV